MIKVYERRISLTEQRARVALGILFEHEQELIGRTMLCDADLLEAGQVLVADLLHLFKRERVEKVISAVVIEGVKRFEKEED